MVNLAVFSEIAETFELNMHSIVPEHLVVSQLQPVYIILWEFIYPER